MRGLAYRRQKARNKYARRVNQIFYATGGYKISDGHVIRCESVDDYMESENPYMLKTQGNFEHHSGILEKHARHKQLKKDRQNKQLNTQIDE